MRRYCRLARAVVLATPLLASRAYPQQDSPEPLVLFDVVFNGASANSIEPGDSALASLATDSVRAGLARSGRFEVIEPGRTRAAIIEASGSGIDCVSLECLRSVGRTLGARWMVTGRLSKVSNLMWYLSGQLTEVATGRRYLDDEFEIKGVAGDMVRGGGAALGRRIVKAAGAAGSTSPGARLSADQVRSRLAASTAESPADFRGADFSGLDLHGIDLRPAVLTGARFVGANLAGANLQSRDLTGADLSSADLTGANLDASTLRRAVLRAAILRKASIFAVILEEADLSQADLTGARVFGYFRKARLAGTIFRSANIGADPGNQSMGVMRSTFVGADLTGADFTDANLFKADLSYATLRDAKLVRSDLRNGALIGADLTGADLTDARLGGTDISGAIFTRTAGMDRISDLAETRNRDKAVFDAR